MTMTASNSSFAARADLPRIAALGWIALLIAAVLAGFLVGTLADRFASQSGWQRYSAQRVSALYLDWQGQVWASQTQGDQLTVYPPDGEPHTIDVGDVTGGLGYVFAVDHQGGLWLGLGDGTVSHRDQAGRWTKYDAELPFGPWPVASLEVDWQGRVWVHVGGELGVIEPGTNPTYTVGEFGQPDTHVAKLAGDRQGQIWIVQNNVLKVLGRAGTWETLGDATNVCLANSGWGQFEKCEYATLAARVGAAPDGSRGEFTLVDAQGRYWAATTSGLWQYDPAMADSRSTRAYHFARLGLTAGLVAGVAAGLAALWRHPRAAGWTAGQVLLGAIAWYGGNTLYYWAANVVIMPRFYDIGVIGAVALFSLSSVMVVALNGLAVVALLGLGRGWLAAGLVLAYLTNLSVILWLPGAARDGLLAFGVGTLPFFFGL